MARNVKLNSRGMADLLKSSGVRAELKRRIAPVEAAAKGNAPVASGEYRDSIRTVSATTDRAVERVEASAPHAFVVEARTGNLARALDAAGGS
jgi:hypothetical protein